MARFEAVIFDLDGIITDTAEYHYLAWEKIGKDIGVTIKRELNEHLRGVSRMESLEQVLKFGKCQGDFTLEEKERLATKKNEYYIELIQQIKPENVLPGIKTLLKNLRGAGYKIGLASASKNAFAVVDFLEVGGYFDYIVDAATVKYSKPNSEVFLKAAQALQVQPKNCIGIEDAVAGVVAINRAGMTSIAIGSDEELKQAHILLKSTSELTLEVIEACSC